MRDSTHGVPDDGTGILALDPWLGPYANQLRGRHAHYRTTRKKVEDSGGLLGPISQGHRYYGLRHGHCLNGQECGAIPGAVPGVWYREWAPGAQQLFLIGDFNEWNRESHPLGRDQWGAWSIFLPDSTYKERLTHGSLIKVRVVTSDGSLDRIPAYIRRVVQNRETADYSAQVWLPETQFEYQNAAPTVKPGEGLRIYEAHVGMAQEELREGTYREFKDVILPRVAQLGYNAIQLMAIQEHPYYGSFGYHVSSMFAVSSRFGTPEDFQALVDAAHGMGILVLLDLVHSHAVKNVLEGLNRFDGTDYQYFHAGPRGEHPNWDSMLFNYSKFEVQRLLLSNIRYWLEEYRIDGFRFDGVTSMIYLDHGYREFETYDDFFSGNVDRDAVAYLQLANELAHVVKPDAITIAEDVSGMVGLARPVLEGGLGFDYRLAMGVPDYWIKLVKHEADEHWNLDAIYHRLLDRRFGEKHIGYAESHDQALVGDKTMAFRLMDQDMYWNMGVNSRSPVIDRGIALHKMIRLITFSLAGEGYLNFMGNEFGHPEWVDFPREGNNYSYEYARRKWSLADNPDLRYAGLARFDAAMNGIDVRFHLLSDPFIELLWVHEDDKLLIFRRGPMVFVFNFHPNRSYSDRRIPVPDAVDYSAVLSTDDIEFGGFGRTALSVVHHHEAIPMQGRSQTIQIYAPARTAQALMPVGRSGN